MKNKLIILFLILTLFSCTNDSNEVTKDLGVENNPVEDLDNKTDETNNINDNIIVEDIIVEDETLIENDTINEVNITEEKVEMIEVNEAEDDIITTTNIESYSLIEVSNHSSSEDCYTVIEGKVYNLTNFFGKHGGGDANLLKLCGIDGTSMFLDRHGESEKAMITRDSFYIGDLGE